MSARPLLRPLCQPHTDLLERSEAYLAAVDLWASRGNAQTLANAVGSGKINVVAALAAKSLRTPTYPLSHFQASSGLSPSAFNAALETLAAAISVPTASSSSSSNPSTPSRSHSHLSTPGSSGSRGGRSRTIRAPNLDSPVPLVGNVQRQRASASASPSSHQMTLQERARAVQSGAAFGMGSPSSSSSRSPTTPTSARRRPAAMAASSPSASPSARQKDKQPSVGFASPSRAQPSSSSSMPSTPRSHRPVNLDKTPTTSQRSAAISPSSSVKSTPRHQQRHLYTPSKRSRLGPREDEDDSDADEEEKEREAGRTVSGKRRRLNGPSTAKQRRKPVPDDGFDYLASRKLPITLFPLCPLTGSGGGKDGKGSVVAAQRVVDDWLDQWGAWLEAGDVRSDEEMADAASS